jgi:hypothetical protein
MNKRKIVKICLCMVLVLVVQATLIPAEQVKATSGINKQTNPELVIVEITKEEYLARLSEADTQVNNTENVTTHETIALPTPIPSQILDKNDAINIQTNNTENVTTHETIALPTPIPSQILDEDATMDIQTNNTENVTTYETIALPTNLIQQRAASYKSTDIDWYADLYTRGGDYMCSVKEVCTVWYYTDGKVHLYKRVISVTKGSANINYGNIVNTDGSVSYTEKDSVDKYFFPAYEYHYIDFIVTSSYYNFSTYWN